MRKWGLVGRIYGMKYKWKGHRDRNRHKNRVKRSGQPKLVYVKDINRNTPTTWRWAPGEQHSTALKQSTSPTGQHCFTVKHISYRTALLYSKAHLLQDSTALQQSTSPTTQHCFTAKHISYNTALLYSKAHLLQHSTALQQSTSPTVQHCFTAKHISHSTALLFSKALQHRFSHFSETVNAALLCSTAFLSNFSHLRNTHEQKQHFILTVTAASSLFSSSCPLSFNHYFACHLCTTSNDLSRIIYWGCGWRVKERRKGRGRERERERTQNFHYTELRF